MNLKEWVISGAVVIALAMSVFAIQKSPVINVSGTPGSDYSNQSNFQGGIVKSGSVATSSLSTAITVSSNEFRSWANASLVSYAPGLLNVTLTLPASSTLAALVPRPGDSQEFCMRNATSTAGTYVTIAGGTGTLLNVASSSVSALGSAVLMTGEVGCFTLIRETSTATSYDIDVLFTVFK